MDKYKDKMLTDEERTEDLLNRLSLAEKVAQMDMIRGVEFATKEHEAHFCAVDPESELYEDMLDEALKGNGIGFVHDIYSVPKVLNKMQKYVINHNRWGIPCIFTGEALHGINAPGATIFPMPINFGATFSPGLINSVGKQIGSETRSLGIQEILAPNLDLSREPRWGRVEETFGEDTHLSSKMAYALVSGEQGDNFRDANAIMAEPKHFCVHAIPEGGLNCSPARVGTREVETSYLPVFEAGIAKAGAYNVMASYNCIDGEAVISSKHYLREIVKKRYGLRGYIRADFGAVRRLQETHHMTNSPKESIKRAILGGLDVQGFDFSNEVWQDNLIQLVNSGEIDVALINDSVRRILLAKFRLGLFDQPYTDEENFHQIVRGNESKALSYQVAKESIVLLKNNNNFLPLNKSVKSIALLGPSSNHQKIGSYSSTPYGYKVHSLADEIKHYVDESTVITQLDGCGITPNDFDVIPATWFENGVELTFYNNPDFSGEPVGKQVSHNIRFNWMQTKPNRNLPFNGYSVQMRATLNVNTHEFVGKNEMLAKLIFRTEDSVKLYLDDVLLIDSMGDHKQQLPSVDYQFVNGTQHELRIEYICDRTGNDLQLAIDYHQDQIEEAVEIAKRNEVIIVACGDNNTTSGEGKDRSDIILFGQQRELISRLTQLGKPLILVLENGKPIDLTEEVDGATAIVESWFGGEFGAKAILDVIFGKYNPSGRLPITFPKSVGELPCYYTMLPGGADSYLEGKKQARYPFGYGMSFTHFEFSNLTINKRAQYDFEVKMNIENIGEVEGAEVVQLYINDKCTSVVTPLKELKAFEKVNLLSGQKKSISFNLDFDSFKLFNLEGKWVVEPGEFEILIGKSSEEIILKDIITID